MTDEAKCQVSHQDTGICIPDDKLNDFPKKELVEELADETVDAVEVTEGFRE